MTSLSTSSLTVCISQLAATEMTCVFLFDSKLFYFLCPYLINSKDDEANEDVEDVEDEETKHYSFPEIDAQIREAVSNYGAVFPKLNFSSPKESIYACLLKSAVLKNPI